jgi:hypothetical protein
MSNQSFSDLSSQQRRERIAAVLAMGLARVLDQASCQSIDTVDNQPFDFPRINSSQQSIHLNPI